MPESSIDAAPRAGNHVWPGRRALLVIWLFFILYGSFLPFQFTTKAGVVRRNVARALGYPLRSGVRGLATSDVVSNVLLFLPYGYLVAASGAGRRGGRVRVIAAGVSGLLFSTMIEAGQLFTVERIASPLDVVADTLGAVAGAIAAHVVERAGRGRHRDEIRGLVGEAPWLVPLGLLALALIADSFYPFSVTLDGSTIWRNLQQGHWVPLRHSRPWFWGDVLMDQVVPVALLAALVRYPIQRVFPGVAPASRAWLATVSFVVGLELGKLFFEGLHPEVDHILLGAMATFLGVTFVPAITRSGPVRARPGWVLLLVAAALLAHFELTPFSFTSQPSRLAANAGRIEWMPLANSFRLDFRSALFDLWNKVALSGFFGFAAAAAWRRAGWKVTAVGLGAGLLLETAQLFTVSRVPSLGDVLIIGVGAHVGGVAYAWYRALVGGGRRCDPCSGIRRKNGRL